MQSTLIFFGNPVETPYGHHGGRKQHFWVDWRRPLCHLQSSSNLASLEDKESHWSQPHQYCHAHCLVRSRDGTRLHSPRSPYSVHYWCWPRTTGSHVQPSMFLHEHTCQRSFRQLPTKLPYNQQPYCSSVDSHTPKKRTKYSKHAAAAPDRALQGLDGSRHGLGPPRLQPIGQQDGVCDLFAEIDV